jgi:hypothetical protein
VADLPLAKGGPCRNALDGPREALHAIHQDGLCGFRFERVELAQTVLKLARAVQEPTREMLADAREAVAALAAPITGPSRSNSCSGASLASSRAASRST